MAKTSRILNAAVVVSALGYFVDIYDLVLFSIVRVSSLKAISIPDGKILESGVLLLNIQMFGMLLGGIIWGILGDKKGRVSVLFGSIFLYSISNILNAFVTNIGQYGLLRFLAGVGLAGELGAAIALVSEILPKEKRGYGTTIVASVGICGAVLAGLIGDYFSWQIAYMVGGGLGLLLLALRMSTFESGLFHSVKESNIRRGDFFMLFQKPERFGRYIYSILIGLPVWFVIGILITFSPELSRELQVIGDIQAGRAILFSYVGLALGDLSSGLLSQIWHSRKKAMFLFMAMTAIGLVAYTQSQGWSEFQFYGLCVYLGFATGYWAVFVSAAAEQFGTNLRATVSTTVPNFIRGSVIPLTLSFQYLHQQAQHSLISSAAWVGFTSLCIAFFALTQLKETFAVDLDFVER